MNRPLVIAVDFDGTLCEHRFPDIGEPHRDVITGLLGCGKLATSSSCGPAVRVNT